jgi:hypothetical protein
MTAKVRRPLRVIAFNANDIWRQRYELSKEPQDLHIDVDLLSETYSNPVRGSLLQINNFIRLTAFREERHYP